MVLKTVSIGEIVPYKNNPRNNDNAVDAVAESIRQCGYVSPIIVDENMVVLAGHTRLKAVNRLGWDEVRVAVAEGLTEDQKRKYRILDNKTNELAEWNVAALEAELDGLDFEGFDFGFCEEEDDHTESVADPEADVPFTEVLGEEHNYIVLYFDNDVDWLQLLSIVDVDKKRI